MRGLMRGMVIAAIRRAKSSSTYEVAPNIPTHSLLYEMARRGVSLLRAQWSLRRVRGGWLRFTEEGVRIRHRRHCQIGRGSVMEAHAQLACLSRQGIRIGDGVTIGKFSILECTGVLSKLAEGIIIGDWSALGDYTFVGGAGGVTIGSRVLMGQRISIHSQNHNFGDPNVPIAGQGTTEAGVKIGDDCWIGSGVVILDGVEIGAGCVVAAGAVVTNSFPTGSVIAGVPARLVKRRTAEGGTSAAAADAEPSRSWDREIQASQSGGEEPGVSGGEHSDREMNMSIRRPDVPLKHDDATASS